MRVAVRHQWFVIDAAPFFAQRNCEMASYAAPPSLERLFNFHRDLGVILTSCA
jgi:hypothetical protein